MANKELAAKLLAEGEGIPVLHLPGFHAHSAVREEESSFIRMTTMHLALKEVQ